jgi:hypothetical protein
VRAARSSSFQYSRGCGGLSINPDGARESSIAWMDVGGSYTSRFAPTTARHVGAFREDMRGCYDHEFPGDCRWHLLPKHHLVLSPGTGGKQAGSKSRQEYIARSACRFGATRVVSNSLRRQGAVGRPCIAPERIPHDRSRSGQWARSSLQAAEVRLRRGLPRCAARPLGHVRQVQESVDTRYLENPVNLWATDQGIAMTVYATPTDKGSLACQA